MAAFVPKPRIKLPIATKGMLGDASKIICPAMQTIHAIIYPFFLPKLSAKWDITKYPNRDPKYMRDCRDEEIHSFEQTITIP